MIESFKVSKTFGQDVFSKPLIIGVTWLIKSFSIEIILCLYCEKFYIALENCQNSCALIAKTRSSGIISLL
ncbi:unnamed protein product [Arctia plantaginis]|uniref:Uncharacterized protein n=1 Tax=Arctia plantaginis TaxID=874455 RepID=A0A8S1AKP4_ARCPL|nr:unnamed protein product [Arctia plantaginis]